MKISSEDCCCVGLGCPPVTRNQLNNLKCVGARMAMQWPNSASSVAPLCLFRARETRKRDPLAGLSRQQHCARCPRRCPAKRTRKPPRGRTNDGSPCTVRRRRRVGGSAAPVAVGLAPAPAPRPGRDHTQRSFRAHSRHHAGRRRRAHYACTFALLFIASIAMRLLWRVAHRVSSCARVCAREEGVVHLISRSFHFCADRRAARGAGVLRSFSHQLTATRAF